MKKNIFTGNHDTNDLATLELPAGLTLEALDEYASARRNAQRRADYQRHPERVLAQRLRAAVNLLEREGVIDRITATGARGWIMIQHGAEDGRRDNG